MLLRSLPVAAFLTERHPDLIRRWVRQGKVSAYKNPFDGTVLVDLHSLRDFDQQTPRRANKQPGISPSEAASPLSNR